MKYETIDRIPTTKRETTAGEGDAEVIAYMATRCPKCGGYISEHQQEDAIRRDVVRCVQCGHEEKVKR